MAQHDYVLSNQSGLAFRSDVNNALAAVVSQNSGAAQPSTTYAYMPWADTTAGISKIRNAANNGWVSLFRLDGTFSLMPPADGAVTTAKLADGALAASAAGLLKMADGYLAASTAGRAKMSDGFTTTAKLDDGAVTPAKLERPFTLAASIASTSGTAVDFTSLPSWVSRVTVMLNGVSTNGTSGLVVRLGTSSSFETTGYFSYSSAVTSGTTAAAAETSGIAVGFNTAAAARVGSITIQRLAGNTWIYTGLIGDGAATGVVHTAGIKALAGALTRLRVTSINGTDVFDAGSLSISYEG